MELNEKVLQAVKDNPKSTGYKLAKKIGVSWDTINRHLLRLMVRGEVQSSEITTLGKKAEIWEAVVKEEE